VNLPKNGQSLVDLRMRGTVPELPVLVSLAGALDFNNVTLQADAGAGYDWRIVAGLEVEVFTSVSVNFQKVLRTLVDIAAAVPSRMVLTFSEGAQVGCGESRVVHHADGDFALFDWFPMAVGPKGYVAGSVVEKQLWKAIADGRIPMPFDKAREVVGEILKEKQQCA
jgi:hypothetical protein